MRVLVWHVHGSWTTALVQGPHTYLVPVLADRGPDGRGRARTWDWPDSVVEVEPADIARAEPDVVILQRPHEIELLREWTGWRAGLDLPAVFVEHNTPGGHAARSRHPLADRDDVPVVHVTAFNELVWDNGRAPTRVIEHGVPDPRVADPRITASAARACVAVVVNEPVRRWRVAGTDLVLRMAARAPVDVYGMGVDQLQAHCPGLAGRLHVDLPQARLHRELARHRLYFHPYRWTSLGLALIEAMMLGLPVLAVAATAAPDAVPAEAGVVSADVECLIATARRWLADADEARTVGAAARAYALARFGLGRFLDDWDSMLQEVAG